ncbi:MAG: FAD-dependent monooxygenase [Pseudomonadota bacterium]
MRILIAGAGMAGLSIGGLLARAGFEVRVFEQAETLSEVGAGIQISANAGHVLKELGLEQRLADASFKPDEWIMRAAFSGRPVTRIPLGAHHSGLHGQPYCQLHRSDLQAMLRHALTEVAPDALNLGRQVARFEETECGATLHFTDGDPVHGDLVIGADGVKSAIRAQIAGADMPTYSGNTAWRGVLPADRLPEGFMPSRLQSFMGPGRHMVMYWLDGGRLLNFVGPVEMAQESEESWTTRHDKAELKADYEGWHDDVQHVIDAMDPDACYRWALNYRPPLSNWRSARATLIGDAAHPTLPFLAQGAAMALEDAAVLTRCLLAFDLDEALNRYQSLRMGRTARVVEGANRMGHLFHYETEEEMIADVSGKASDIATDRDRWLYNYNPVTIPLEEAA